MSGFIIRDALEKDIASCMAISHTYETEFVWQMNIFQELDRWNITFRTERLPRAVQVKHTADERRLRLCLPEDQCFIVAAEREDNPVEIVEPFEPDDDGDEDGDGVEETPSPPIKPPTIISYLTMRYEPVRRVAWIQDIVVDEAFRRQRIGTRLLSVAKNWAIEQGASRLMVETLTKNYPMINFCVSNGLIFCGYNEHYLENQDIAVFFGDSL